MYFFIFYFSTMFPIHTPYNINIYAIIMKVLDHWWNQIILINLMTNTFNCYPEELTNIFIVLNFPINVNQIYTIVFNSKINRITSSKICHIRESKIILIRNIDMLSVPINTIDMHKISFINVLKFSISESYFFRNS